MSTDRGTSQRHALGVDFGTSNTVAVARWPDGRARPLLIDGSPLLPSAVYAEPDGHIAVGRDAVHSARLDPARFEPNPKRRIDDGEVLLAEREVPVADLIAAVLARVAEEWRRTVGESPTDVTLTCPATWGTSRRTLLAEAAAQAGFPHVRLVAEPVAAATYFAEVLGRDVPIGSVVVVHDFGAGTFDASVVARTAEGFEVLAVDGRDDIGGLDVDAAVVAHLATLFGEDEHWRALTEPATVGQRRAQREMWDDVRVAKERLSRTQAADLVVPLVNAEVHLTRDELEKLARPLIDQTVEVTRGLLRWADLPEGKLAGVFLVGGASRIPLVATLLHRALDEAPVVIEQPELVVAEGSILAGAALLAGEPAAPGPTSELRLVAARRRESETVRVPRTIAEQAEPAGPDATAPDATAPASGPPAARTPGTPPAAAAAAGPAGALNAPTAVQPARPPGAPSSGPPQGSLSGPAASLSGPAGPTAGATAIQPTRSQDPSPGAQPAAPPSGRTPVPPSSGHTPPASGRTPVPSSSGRTPVPSSGHTPPASGRTPVPPTARPAEARRSLDDAETEPHGPFPPAVDPWAHVPPEPWRPDPAQTVISDASWPHQRPAPAPTPVPAPSRPPMDRTRVDHPPTRTTAAPPDPGRPLAPSVRSAPVRPPEPAPKPQKQPRRSPKAPQVRQPAPARPKRARKHPFLRFLRGLIMLGLLIGAPAVALVLAYGWNNDVPFADDVRLLIKSVAEHLGNLGW